MKRFWGWIPLALLAYFTGEIVTSRLGGRVPSQVSAPFVWGLVLVSVGWLAVEVRRKLSRVHFD